MIRREWPPRRWRAYSRGMGARPLRSLRSLLLWQRSLSLARCSLPLEPHWPAEVGPPARPVSLLSPRADSAGPRPLLCSWRQAKTGGTLSSIARPGVIGCTSVPPSMLRNLHRISKHNSSPSSGSVLPICLRAGDSEAKRRRPASPRSYLPQSLQATTECACPPCHAPADPSLDAQLARPAGTRTLRIGRDLQQNDALRVVTTRRGD